MQLAVFKNPDVLSSITGNIGAVCARGGILCKMLSIPDIPGANAVIKNGEWEEISNPEEGYNIGSTFSIELDGSDEASTHLISALRNSKSIEELIIYEMNGCISKAVYGYYFSRLFAHGAAFHEVKHHGVKAMILNLSCMSFKQKDANNQESVLWDWNTHTHTYTGNTK